MTTADASDARKGVSVAQRSTVRGVRRDRAHAQAAGELDHGALAGGEPGPGGGAGQAERAGHGHDAAVPGGAHRGGGRAAGQPGAHHVDLQAGPQRRNAELVYGAAGLDAGAGHQHVEPAAVSQDPVDQAGYGGFAGDVAGLAAHAAPGPGGQPGCGVGAADCGPAGQHDIGTCPGQRGGDRQAEPGRAAGDHGDLPGPRRPRPRGRRAGGRLVMTGLAAHTRHDRRARHAGPDISATPPAARCVLEPLVADGFASLSNAFPVRSTCHSGVHQRTPTFPAMTRCPEPRSHADVRACLLYR
jgi:hypothetical protein